MTDTLPQRIEAAEGADIERKCFTYCGDQCTCPAKTLYDTLKYIAPALPVLETMCRSVGLQGGANRAAEMHEEVAAALRAKDQADG